MRLIPFNGRTIAVFAALFIAAIPAAGYYHFLHYVDGPAGRTAIPEKFDLNALLDSTVYFHVSSESPKLASNDSYEALLSQIRQALGVWDGVPVSALRVAYGGVRDIGLDDNTPGGDIIFAELPPGVIGFGGPVVRAAPAGGFVPIVRSQVILSNDFTQGNRPRQSFSELFFNSLVHEIGHAIGLQHSMASSAMSTDITRATTRARPLDADDIAGIHALYPHPRFQRVFGSISGRIVGGDGLPVALASVAAISRGGAVVTALSGPDGRYRIDGLLAGAYQLYVQPLPPATQQGLGPANIVLPVDQSGNILPASGPFRSVFHGGSNRPGDSRPVTVFRGRVASDLDFQVTPVDSAPVANVVTWSFPGNQAPGVHPAFLNVNEPDGFLLATGDRLVENLDNLSVEVLGGDVRVLRASRYQFDSRFARFDFDLSPFTSLGPRHLIFRLNDDIHILPSGVQLVGQSAPIIDWVSDSFDSLGGRVWTVRGQNFDARSLVYCDGLPASVIGFSPSEGEIEFLPPPGAPGHRSVVTVYNPDGQSSAFTLPDGNPVYAYADTIAPGPLHVTPDSVETGQDAVILIEASGVNFSPGQTVVGFGSSDMVARDVEVLDAGRLRVSVTVREQARAGGYLVSVTNGLQLLVRRDALRAGPPSTFTSSRPVLKFGALVNAATGEPDLSPGVLAVLTGINLALPNARVTLDGQAALLLETSPERILLQVPESLPPGRVLLEVDNGIEKGNPVLAAIDRVSPGLFAAVDAAGQAIASQNPLRPGEKFTLLATGLGTRPFNAQSLFQPVLSTLVFVEANGVRLLPETIERIPERPGYFAITLRVPGLTAASASISVLADGRRSNTLNLPASLGAAGALGVVH